MNERTEHGTHAGYLAHFTGPYADKEPCDECKKGHAKYKRDLWRRKYLLGEISLYVDATGIKRRIRALQWMGWRLEDIAREAGYKGTQPSKWLHNISYQKKIHLKRHAAICGAYDRLCMFEGPSSIAAKSARRRGCAPPLAWDDETIDDPKAKPQGIPGQWRKGKAA